MKLEPLKPSSFYHFYNRGNNKERIFIEEDNYFYFLKLVKKYLIQIVDIYSYCLLPNHFHLLFRVKDENKFTKHQIENIHQHFSNLFNAYTKAFNKMYHRTGSLFQKHPKRILIENEAYIKNLITYINTNPDHHAIANYENYKHSSYKALISNQKTLLMRDGVINYFDDVKNFKYVLQLKKINIEHMNEYLLE